MWTDNSSLLQILSASLLQFSVPIIITFVLQNIIIYVYSTSWLLKIIKAEVKLYITVSFSNVNYNLVLSLQNWIITEVIFAEIVNDVC